MNGRNAENQVANARNGSKNARNEGENMDKL